MRAGNSEPRACGRRGERSGAGVVFEVLGKRGSHDVAGRSALCSGDSRELTVQSGRQTQGSLRGSVSRRDRAVEWWTAGAPEHVGPACGGDVAAKRGSGVHVKAHLVLRPVRGVGVVLHGDRPILSRCLARACTTWKTVTSWSVISTMTSSSGAPRRRCGPMNSVGATSCWRARFVEAVFTVDGVGDGVERVGLVDTVLVGTGGPTDPHTSTVRHNLDLAPCECPAV